MLLQTSMFPHNSSSMLHVTSCRDVPNSIKTILGHEDLRISGLQVASTSKTAVDTSWDVAGGQSFLNIDTSNVYFKYYEVVCIQEVNL